MPVDLTPVDDDLAAALDSERDRQRDTLSLIASENHASEAVLAAQGSVLTNKYAEGAPGERYYGGCEHADTVEELAQERARELFGAEYVNVQPHSGTGANLAAYQALLDPGDRILSLSMSHGGHLSHGQPDTMVDDHFDVHHYGVDTGTGRLDYEAVERRAREADPDLLVSGYSAYPRQVDFERMQAIAGSVGASHVADIAHLTGLVAAGVHPSPVGVADVVTCSTHKTVRAGRGGMVMCSEDLADAIETAVMPGCQGGPLMHNVAGKAAGFGDALTPEFDDYARQIRDNADALADRLRARGFDLVSGGTDVHFVLVDFRETHPELTGAAAEAALEAVGLVANKQTVPGDPRKATVASGLRVGTPAVTTRGFDADATLTMADAIADVLDAPADDLTVRRFERGDGERVRELAESAMARTPEWVPGAPDRDLDDVESQYLDAGGEFLVGVHDGDAVATGAYEPLEGWMAERFPDADATAELSRMRVAPDCWGRGYGIRMYRELEARARADGSEAFVLNTGVENDRARRFYESLGFDAVEEVAVEFEDLTLELALSRTELG